MPSHNPVFVEQPPQDQQLSQIKVCVACHSTLIDSTTSVFLPEADAIVCTNCRDSILSARAAQGARIFQLDVGPNFIQRTLHEAGNSFQDTRHTPESPIYDDEMLMDSAPEPGRSYQDSSTSIPTYSNPSNGVDIPIDTSNLPNIPHQSQSHSLSPVHTTTMSRHHIQSFSSPEPLTDITRLRVRSQGHHCLHPGATFQGTQKSGRNSYDVTVTIVVRYFCPSLASPIFE